MVVSEIFKGPNTIAEPIADKDVYIGQGVQELARWFWVMC